MLFQALLLCAVALPQALAHPHAGVPKLMGRNGALDIRSLADRSGLVRRAVSPDGTCGATSTGGYTCGTDVNKCCSQYGWCGDTSLHCADECQVDYGICTDGTEPGGRCGTQGNGTVCADAADCCSSEGWCGTTSDHCMAPYCQEGFGKCDSDYVPAGGSTSDVVRTHAGSVPYGTDIYDCVNAGDIALTYDDGPDVYTDAMLDILTSYNAKATFFITGINNAKGPIDTTPAWNAVIQKMYAAGHQLASHTWSHADLSTLTEAKRRTEMYKLEAAMRNIVGFFPTYMRPPYSSCNAACMATMNELGYHITYFDLDTDDYNNVTPDLIQNAKNNFANKVNPSDPTADAWLTIAHDIHEQTAMNLTQYMLETLQAKGYKAVTVGECMGDPVENWYRYPSDTPVSSSSSSSSTTLAPTTTLPPTSTTSATTAPSSCPTTVATWCPAELPSYTDIAGCWTAVGQCWDAGDLCWSTVPAEVSAGCETYQAICQNVEDHCQSCITAVGSGVGPCAELEVVY